MPADQAVQGGGHVDLPPSGGGAGRMPVDQAVQGGGHVDLPPGSPDAPSPELYARTYMTLLRSSGVVRLHALEAAHVRMRSSLHMRAGLADCDAGAFIYAMQRLPLCVAGVDSVVIGQEGEQFRAVLGDEVEQWERVEAAARRRAWRWDGSGALTIHASSLSDLDDVVPCLVAYQIEWNKLHEALSRLVTAGAGGPLASSPAAAGEGSTTAPPSVALDALGPAAGMAASDWARLQRIHGTGFLGWLQSVARARKDMHIQFLGGNDIAHARLARRWWRPIGAAVARRGLEGRPLYFVSSNLHAIVNLVSGYVRRRRTTFLDFLEGSSPSATVRDEVEALGSLRRSDNLLYYVSRLWHQAHREETLRLVRRHEEAERGIAHVDAVAGFDVGAQLIELCRLRKEDLDPRLGRHADVIERSDAIILNVDYPLGLASYHIVREVATAWPTLRGIYAIGKAATLNAAIGDVLLSDTVFDEHSGNSYAFPNAFRSGDLAPFLERASALDNQSAVTVRGTFLQNQASLERYYRERFTVVEMEAGPILSAIYEATRPERHPTGQRVYFRELPFDLGIIHYASDTPNTQARTLGSRGLSVEGIDATYAASLAVMDRILAAEARRLGHAR